MARATRSSATQPHSDKDKQPDPPSTTARTKLSTKKRKRTSLADNDDHPPPKQLRSDTSIKEENQLDIDDDNPNRQKLQHLQPAADLPIDPSDAHQILDILELADSQGLLDRVFPLPPPDLSEPSTSKAQFGSFSLRALLREPSQHPLRVLRAAVKNLFPISYHPRARPSSPAAQQLRFCNLACSLLDQASFHSVPLPLDIDSLLDFPDASSIEVKPSPPSSHPEKHAHSHPAKKYALMQRLPFATWWTSLNSDLVPSDSKPLKDLSTANAELVAILPTPSAPAPVEAGNAEASPVTLASYVPKKPPGYKPKLPGPRRVSCGAFLDYGPYASFAPVFEQDGVEVGKSTMGELFSRWEDRKKRWIDEQKHAVQQPLDALVDPPQPNGVGESDKSCILDDGKSLEGLFSTEQIYLFKQALGSLELEGAVQELLERNAKALKRLEELQNKRLIQPGEFKPVEEGSEEWDIAQGILDSLCLFASLRPRWSTSDHAPLIPSTSALHKLQRTLPIAPTQGWRGTLPAEHVTAIRDDSTLYIKSTATAIPAAQPAPPAQTPTAAQPTPAQATVATAAAAAQAYAGYSYNYATPYRAGYQFKPGQPTPYYPNAYGAQTTQAQAAPQYYQAQPYNATGQQQYTYQSWYPYNPQAQSNVAAGGSRKGTPQPSTAATTAAPAATAPSTIPTSYAGFFSATTQTPGQRAVANTVAAATPVGKPYQPAAGTWTTPAGPGATGYVAPTLPPHMRNAVAGQAGVAGAYSAGLYQPNYYGAYQATPSPAQS